MTEIKYLKKTLEELNQSQLLSDPLLTDRGRYEAHLAWEAKVSRITNRMAELERMKKIKIIIREST